MCSTWQYVQLLSTTVDSAGTSHWDYKDEQALHRAKGKGVILHDTKKKVLDWSRLAYEPLSETHN